MDTHQKIAYLTRLTNRWLAIQLEFLTALVIFIVALIVVLNRDTLSPAIVGLALTYSLKSTLAISHAVRFMAELETNLVSVDRLNEYIHEPTEAPLNQKYDENIEFHNGKIDFINFSVRYREALDNVINNITFSIKSKKKIGVVGRTGAGKSSLTLSIFRILEASNGKILIDKHDISKIGLQKLRSCLTIIPQDPVLFSGTLRFNIDPFEKHSDVKLWSILKLSHLDYFVANLPLQLDHEISEGGENLSIGQRQLVCLARALLKKTKIIILDEATGGVDIETDELIQRTIRVEFADCTIITIAHRLNTIMNSDRILVLDKGKVMEYDEPKTLLKNKNGIFYGMAEKSGLV